MTGDHPSETAAVAVTAHGPYLVTGRSVVRGVDGGVLHEGDEPVYLCRCGGSRTKPFCDATHGLKGFDGMETADPDDGAVGEASDARTSTEEAAGPGVSITALVDGPYDVRGTVELTGSDGVVYAPRRRQRLCRCGRSTTKPFCDDTHLSVGFRDPAPPTAVPPLYDWCGGIEALRRLTERFYADLLEEPDPVLEPVFRGMDPAHPAHVAAWLGETFGGPTTFTADHGGYEHMVARHRGLALTETQRARWISRMAATADLVGLPDDPDFRSAFLAYLEWGTRIAVYNSAPGAQVIERAPVPRWGWGESPPYVPQPWEVLEPADSGQAPERPASPRHS